MDFSAVVCTRDRYDFLSKAIDSLVAQPGLGETCEIVVVDNSCDATRAASFATPYHGIAGLTFLHVPARGLSHARNAGTAVARGRIVAFLDDDAIASSGWARSLIDAFDAFGSEAGIVGGPVEPIWEVAPTFALRREIADVLSLVDRGPSLRVLMGDEWLAGCNIAFDRRALLDAGGFDPNLGRTCHAAVLLSNEETVACDRIKQSGKKMIYAPGAAVRHFIPAERTGAEWITRRIAWQAVSDAISNPERTRDHARFIASEKRLSRRVRRAVNLFRFWDRSPRQIAKGDYALIYDTVNRFLCTGL